MATSFVVKKKRNVNERWESSQKKRTFKFDRDDSEDESGDGLVMIEARVRTERRSASMDLIPACVPESVGLEIEDIIQTNFGHNGKGYNLDPDYGIKTKKSSKSRSPQKKASPRTMSTEDLPPNLLPEDYLDEVISQYFNDDCGKKITASRRESLKQLLSENSSNDEEEEDLRDERVTLTEEEEGGILKPARSKVKTDEELESEYKHIIFGAKKRKAPRLGFGSPKKKKKSSKDRDRSETRKRPEEIYIKPIKIERSVSPRKEREKVEVKNKMEESHVVPPNNETNITPRKETLEEKFEKIVNDKKKQLKIEIETVPTNSNVLPKFQSKTIPVKLDDDHIQKWAGKKASRRAVDRSKLLITGKQRLAASPKIEDVTGKYSKEEELVTCGICEMLDPPVDQENPQETTEWVGCDCYRWFHKSCTKLTKFTEKFSCKSVRMRCQEAAETPDTKPVTAVLQVAILKFIRDRDITFIEDILW